jgi:uncharacterized protein
MPHPVSPGDAAGFITTIRQNPYNDVLLDRLPSLGLPDCWLVAGCLFQTAWNLKTGRPPTEHIKDYDIFYFDNRDLSFEAEDREIRRLTDAFVDLDVVIEIKNQARVHLWYQQKFGNHYPPLRSSTDGIDRYLVAATCVGISCSPAEPPALYTTYGLDELYAGILRPNPLNSPEDRFIEKCLSYRTRWPWLRIENFKA